MHGRVMHRRGADHVARPGSFAWEPKDDPKKKQKKKTKKKQKQKQKQKQQNEKKEKKKKGGGEGPGVVSVRIHPCQGAGKSEDVTTIR